MADHILDCAMGEAVQDDAATGVAAAALPPGGAPTGAGGLLSLFCCCTPPRLTGARAAPEPDCPCAHIRA